MVPNVFQRHNAKDGTYPSYVLLEFANDSERKNVLQLMDYFRKIRYFLSSAFDHFPSTYTELNHFLDNQNENYGSFRGPSRSHPKTNKNESSSQIPQPQGKQDDIETLTNAFLTSIIHLCHPKFYKIATINNEDAAINIENKELKHSVEMAKKPQNSSNNKKRKEKSQKNYKLEYYFTRIMKKIELVSDTTVLSTILKVFLKEYSNYKEKNLATIFTFWARQENENEKLNMAVSLDFVHTFFRRIFTYFNDKLFPINQQYQYLLYKSEIIIYYNENVHIRTSQSNPHTSNDLEQSINNESIASSLLSLRSTLFIITNLRVIWKVKNRGLQWVKLADIRSADLEDPRLLSLNLHPTATSYYYMNHHHHHLHHLQNNNNIRLRSSSRKPWIDLPDGHSVNDGDRNIKIGGGGAASWCKPKKISFYVWKNRERMLIAQHINELLGAHELARELQDNSLISTVSKNIIVSAIFKMNGNNVIWNMCNLLNRYCSSLFVNSINFSDKYFVIFDDGRFRHHLHYKFVKAMNVRKNSNDAVAKLMTENIQNDNEYAVEFSASMLELLCELFFAHKVENTNRSDGDDAASHKNSNNNNNSNSNSSSNNNNKEDGSRLIGVINVSQQRSSTNLIENKSDDSEDEEEEKRNALYYEDSYDSDSVDESSEYDWEEIFDVHSDDYNYDKKRRRSDSQRNEYDCKVIIDQRPHYSDYYHQKNEENLNVVDFTHLKRSKQYRTFLQFIPLLSQIYIDRLNVVSKIKFLINILNAMIIHSYIISSAFPSSPWDIVYLENKAKYQIGGEVLSIHAIKSMLLRSFECSEYLGVTHSSFCDLINSQFYHSFDNAKNDDHHEEENSANISNDDQSHHINQIDNNNDNGNSNNNNTIKCECRQVDEWPIFDFRLLFVIATHLKQSPMVHVLNHSTNLEDCLDIATENFLKQNFTVLVDQEIVFVPKFLYDYKKQFKISNLSLLCVIRKYLSVSNIKKIDQILNTYVKLPTLPQSVLVLPFETDFSPSPSPLIHARGTPQFRTRGLI